MRRCRRAAWALTSAAERLPDAPARRAPRARGTADLSRRHVRRREIRDEQRRDDAVDRQPCVKSCARWGCSDYWHFNTAADTVRASRTRNCSRRSRRGRARVVISAVPPFLTLGLPLFGFPSLQSRSSPRGTSRAVSRARPWRSIAGRPMIEHVYRRAAAAALVSRVIVATDDRRIVDAGPPRSAAKRVMTARPHQSGTDRLAEVAATLDCDLVVNVQGDEPAARAGDDRRAPSRRLAVATIRRSEMSTAAAPHRGPPQELRNPNAHQGRRRSRRLRDVFLARADSASPAPAQPAATRPGRTSASTSTGAPACCRVARAAADRAGARRSARAAPRARARHPDQGDRNASRHDRRRHAGGS